MSIKLQIGLLVLFSCAMLARAFENSKPCPMAESALGAEWHAVRALLANDADAVGYVLADDWVVVSTYGGVADRTGFLDVIKSGNFVRKTMDISDIAWKLYGHNGCRDLEDTDVGNIHGQGLHCPGTSDRCLGLARWRLDIRPHA